eukprot:15443807-Alexandrium_andersonii.AAC.1
MSVWASCQRETEIDRVPLVLWSFLEISRGLVVSKFENEFPGGAAHHCAQDSCPFSAVRRPLKDRRSRP